MRNIFLDIKIKNDLKEFKKFKENYNFVSKKITQKDDGSIFCDSLCFRKSENEPWIGEAGNILNVGYNIKNTQSRIISNLFSYQFYFKGFRVSSIESVFQCLKYKSKKLQKMVFKYSGIEANLIKGASDYNWRETGELYFLGKKINRFSASYEDFIDELYISAIQNKLYKNALINVGSKHIIHTIGEKSNKETLFTQQEFEKELNCLKDFLILKNSKGGK